MTVADLLDAQLPLAMGRRQVGEGVTSTLMFGGVGGRAMSLRA